MFPYVPLKYRMSVLTTFALVCHNFSHNCVGIALMLKLEVAGCMHVLVPLSKSLVVLELLLELAGVNMEGTRELLEAILSPTAGGRRQRERHGPGPRLRLLQPEHGEGAE